MAKKIVFAEASKEEIEQYYKKWSEWDNEKIFSEIREKLIRLGTPEAVRAEDKLNKERRGILPAHKLMENVTKQAIEILLGDKNEQSESKSENPKDCVGGREELPTQERDLQDKKKRRRINFT